jgi:superfamily II DNA or RNA helicase
MAAPPLRPYQQEAIDLVRNRFVAGDTKIILCAPTGAGKTRIFTELVYMTIQRHPENRVLVVTDRIELFKQTYKAISQRGVGIFELVAGRKVVEPVEERCVVAMVETLHRRIAKPEFVQLLGKFALMIIDEAHKGNFKKTLAAFDCRTIGATATPIASKGNEPISMHYDSIVDSVDIPQLIGEKFLAFPRLIAAFNPGIKGLKDDKFTGEYEVQSHMDVFMNPEVYNNLLQAVEQYANGKKTIIFCGSIAETIGTSEMLTANGHRSVYVVSTSTKEDRAEALRQFHAGEAKIMVNCGILTTGYDHPEIEVVIMYRATKSLPLWLQCCGRGSRVIPGKKEEFTIIDLGENYHRLGHWEKSRDWSSIWLTDGRSKGDGEAPIKDCPVCMTAVHISVKVCPNCEHVFESEKEDRPEGVLIELKTKLLRPQQMEKLMEPYTGRYILDLSPEELYETIKIGRYKKSYADRVCAKQGKDFALRYAKLAGHKPGRVYYVFQNYQHEHFTNRIVK